MKAVMSRLGENGIQIQDRASNFPVPFLSPTWAGELSFSCSIKCIAAGKTKPQVNLFLVDFNIFESAKNWSA